jgi:hypothetical protein
VCSSDLKYSLKVLGEEFDWAAPLKPAYVVCWPYDSGGCGCKDCRPWGSNGFLKLSEQLAALARVKLPGTKFVLSTWMFDKGEWQNVVAGFAERKPFFDCVMAEPPEGPIPGGVPWMGFPEISMHNTFPWGGFGATPLTGLVQGQWNRVKATSSGGFPYSEGIFEDLTKVVISQFDWNDRPAAEPVKEYIAFEFSQVGADCRVKSRSRSQSLSYYDYSTNFCNMWNPLKNTGAFTSQKVTSCPFPTADPATTCNIY